MRKKLALTAVFVAVLVGAYSYVEIYVRHRVEEAVAKSLHKTIGPAQSYDVTIGGNLISMARGHVQSATVRGRHVETDKGIQLDRLLIRLQSVAFRLSTPPIVDAEQTEFEASVTEAELNRYLSNRRHDIPDLTVVLLDGAFRVRALSTAAGHSIPVSADGTLSVANDTKMVCRLSNVTSNGRTAPEFLRKALENRLNPVLDLEEWKLRGKLRSVSIGQRAITLEGSADLTGSKAR